jgi:dienelactone hydrolase
MRKSFFGLFIFLSLALLSSAQGLVNSTRVGTMAIRHTNDRIKSLLGAPSVPFTSKALDLYKISYRTNDSNGRSVVVTGLVAFPHGGAPNGLVVFNHGTTQDRKTSPSRLTGRETSKTGTEAELALLAFASGGYAIAMPDYVGLGDHKGFHPYPANVLNGRTSIDLIAPAREIAQRHNINVGAGLFITGYSQGGSVAMSMVRDLEQKSGAMYEVTAAAPMSGAYDLSGVMREFLLAPNTDQTGFVVRLYLGSYMVYSFHKNHGVKLTDYFKPSMGLTVSSAYAANTTDENVIKRLGLAAVLMRAKNSLANVITPRFKRALETIDTSDPVIREMQQNDVYDWSPRTKMLLINLVHDGVVDPANTETAVRTMRRRGVGPDTLRRYVINDTSLNHVTGVGPALIQARRFFDGGFPAVREAQ